MALDRIQPVLHNQQTQGGTWPIHQIDRDRVMQRLAPVQVGTPALWDFMQQVIQAAVAAGYLRK